MSTLSIQLRNRGQSGRTSQGEKDRCTQHAGTVKTLANRKRVIELRHHRVYFLRQETRVTVGRS